MALRRHRQTPQSELEHSSKRCACLFSQSTKEYERGFSLQGVTRGTKSLLRYGWSLQDLANDTAGVFVENSKKLARTATRLSQLITSLRLVTFEIADLRPGRYRVSASSTSGLRLRSQKWLVVGTSATESRIERVMVFPRPVFFNRGEVGEKHGCLA